MSLITQLILCVCVTRHISSMYFVILSFGENTLETPVHFPCFELPKPTHPSMHFPSITAKALYGQHNDAGISFFSFVVVKVLSARLTSAR